MSNGYSERSPFEEQYWYAGAISERKCEDVLSKTGRSGAFLVRDYLLPRANCNYILSVNSGSEIVHYDVKVYKTEECELNGYTFTSLPEALAFYTENRLHKQFLSMPENPVVSEKIQRRAAPVIMALQPAPPPRSTPLQAQLVYQQQLREDATSPPPPCAALEDGGEWGPVSSGEISSDSYSPMFNGGTHITIGSPANSQDSPDVVPDAGTDSLSMPSLPVKSNESYTSTVDDQIIAQGHVRDPSDICETSFDDVTSLTFHPAPSNGESSSHLPQEANNPITPLEKTNGIPHDDTDKPQAQPHQTVNDGPHRVDSGEPHRENSSEPHRVDSGGPHQAVNSGPHQVDSSEPHRVDSSEPHRVDSSEPHRVDSSGPHRVDSSEPHRVDSGELCSVPVKQSKVPPPVPQRRSSALVTNHTPAHITTSTTESESSPSAPTKVRRLPSLKERKQQLEANMATSSSPGQGQPVEHVMPGKLVIKEAVMGVSAGMPTDQHPLLRKKQEETAAKAREAREREESEQERLAKEMKEKEEKPKKKLSFLRSKKGKGEEIKSDTSSKEQNRRSMTALEKEELKNTFKQLTQHKSSSSDGSNPPSLPPSSTGSNPHSLPLCSEVEVADEEELARERALKEWEEREAEEIRKKGLPPQPQQAQNSSTPDPSQTSPNSTSLQLDSLPEHPEELEQPSHTTGSKSNTLETKMTGSQSNTLETKTTGSQSNTLDTKTSGSQSNTLETKTNGSQSNTLERCPPKPPLSSPPSLPGSIDRKSHRQSNSQSNTLERSRPSSRPGSQPGTLERKTLPHPNSQPPPIPGEGRKEQMKTRTVSTGSIGFTGRRMELVDLIPGVSRQVLTGQAVDTATPQIGGGASSVASRPINFKRKTTIKKRH